MARKRVNKRFLVGLVSIFGVLVLGLLFAGMWYKDSPERAVRRATEADERGDREEAATQWNKAYQRTGRPEYLMKAIDTALTDTTAPDGPEWVGRALGSYQALLAADPEYMPARRGLLELRSGDRGFNAGVVTSATRDVREIAGEILEREPNDTQARALHAIATLNLSQFRGTGVTEEDRAAALETMQKMVVSDPGDGQVILALTEYHVDEARKAFQADNAESALEMLHQAHSTLEKAEPIVGEPGEDATLEEANRSRYLGSSYQLLANLKAAIDANVGQDSAAEDDADEAVAVDSLREKALAHLEKAVEATDRERDALSLQYLRIHGAYAEALYRNGQPESALSVYQALADARPWDAQASAALASALLQQGRQEEAEQVTTAALERQSEPLPQIGGTDGTEALLARFFTKPQFVDVLMSRYEALGGESSEEARKRLEQARSVFASYESERATRRASLTPHALRIRGQLQQADGNLAGAIATYEEAMRMLGDLRSPDGLRLLALAGQANLTLGQLGEAKEAYEQMYRISGGGNLFAARQLAGILIRMGDTAAAQPYVDQLLEADPQNATYQQLAMAATPADDRGERLADMPEETTEQRVNKFNAAGRLGNRDEAIRIGRALLEEMPEHEAIKIGLAVQLRAAGQEEEALAIIRPLAESGNRDASRLLVRWEQGVEGQLAEMEGVERLRAEAELALRQGDRVVAVEKLREASASAPGNTAVDERLFQLYLEQGSFKDAAEVAGQLRGTNADRLGGRSYGIRLRLARGETAQAVEEARQLSIDYRTVAKAQALYGQALAASGQFAEAEEPLQRALDMAPTDVSTISILAMTLDRLGRVADVKRVLEQGLRASPGNPQLASQLRGWELRFGDAQKLIDDARQAVADRPDSAEQHLELVRTLREAAAAAEGTRRPDDVTRYSSQAVTAAIEARQQFPSDPRFLGEMVEAAIRADDAAREKATAEVEAAIADGGPLAESHDAGLIVVEHFARVGRGTQAESLLRALLGRDGLTREQRAAVLMGLSKLASRGGREEEALALLSGYEDLPPVLERKAELLGVRFVRENGSESAYQALRQATDKAIEEDRLGPGGLNVVAVAELQRENFDRAEMLLQASVEKDPNRARTYALQAALLNQKPDPDPDAAVQKLEQARKADPADQEILAQLAQLQAGLGRSEAAAATFRELLAVNPRDVEARLNLINLLLAERSPRYADAAAQFRAAQEAGVGNHPLLLNTRAWMEMRRGQRKQAIETAQQSVAAAAGTPDEGLMLHSYLRLLDEAGAHQQVLDVIDARSTPEGGHPWWMLQARGKALAGLDREEEAIEAYSRAYAEATASQQDVAVLREMGQEVGFDAAWALLAPKVEPEDGSTPTVRDLSAAAFLLVDAGRPDEAIERLNEVLAEVPEEDEQRRAFLNLQVGTLHLQSSPPRYGEAEAAFREALKGLPENIGGLNNLAYTLTLRANQVRGSEERRRMLDEAVEIARRAYDLSAGQSRDNRPDPSVTDTYAGAIAARARQTNDTPALREAERLLRQARQAAEANNRPFPEVYLHLGEVQRDLGNRAGAAQTATAGINLLESRRSAGEQVDESAARALRELLSEVNVEATAGDAGAESAAN